MNHIDDNTNSYIQNLASYPNSNQGSNPNEIPKTNNSQKYSEMLKQLIIISEEYDNKKKIKALDLQEEDYNIDVEKKTLQKEQI